MNYEIKEKINKILNNKISEYNINEFIILYIYNILSKYYDKYTIEIIKSNYIPDNIPKLINKLRNMHRKYKLQNNIEYYDIYNNKDISKAKANLYYNILKYYNKTDNLNKILDFGGGNGNILYEFSKLLNISHKNIYLCDNDEWNGQLWMKNRENKINYIHPSKLKEINIKFDMIIVSHTLHHIKDNIINDIINTFYNILNKNGIILLVEHNITNNMQKMIVDLKHYIFDLIILQNKKPSIYYKKYYSNYKTYLQWNNLFGKFKIIMHNFLKKTDDNTYYTIYEKLC